jgi:hypothetical protein
MLILIFLASKFACQLKNQKVIKAQVGFIRVNQKNVLKVLQSSQFHGN